MSSIYDRLHQRRASRRPLAKHSARRHDLARDRLCLVDGVALNAVGHIRPDEALPEAALAVSCPSLLDRRGFPRLAKPAQGIALDHRHVEAAGRLEILWLALAGALDLLVRHLPESEPADVVLTAPDTLSSQEQQLLLSLIIERLSTLRGWNAAQSQGHLRHSADINAVLAADPDRGGMRWVFWCSVDCLIDHLRLKPLDETLPQNTPLIPGEGASLLLCERVPADAAPHRGRLWVTTSHHIHNHVHTTTASQRGETARAQALKALVAPLVGAEVPDVTWCLMDVGAGGRAADTFAALFTFWPGLHVPGETCLALDSYCGWLGGVAPSTMLIMAATLLQSDAERAILLSLCDDDITTMSVVTPVSVTPAVT